MMSKKRRHEDEDIPEEEEEREEGLVSTTDDESGDGSIHENSEDEEDHKRKSSKKKSKKSSSSSKKSKKKKKKSKRFKSESDSSQSESEEDPDSASDKHKRHKHNKQERRRKHKRSKRHDRYSKSEVEPDYLSEEGDKNKTESRKVQEVPLVIDVDSLDDRGRVVDKGPVFSNKSQESLSVEETNALRAKLGLAPLKIKSRETEDKKKSEPHEFQEYELIASSSKGERHKPPINLAQISKTEKIKQKLQEKREKRRRESKLLTVKGLGEESDEEEGAQAWVKKQEKLSKAKAEAAKRAKILEELDDEFGVGSLVEEDMKKIGPKYKSKDLGGLKVEHSVNHFSEGKDVILTLKDSDILDDSARDTLINVNIQDEEKAKKKIEEAKKAATGGYNPYEQEIVDDFTGEIKRKNLLDKYDEEIDGEIKSSFQIGVNGTYDESEEKKKAKLEAKTKLLSSKTLISLQMPEKKVASDYLTKEEISFKKPKKKKKKVRSLKADDLINSLSVSAGDSLTSFGSRSKKHQDESQLDDDVGDLKDLSDFKAEEDKKLTLKNKIKDKLNKKKFNISDRILESDIQSNEDTFSASGAELIGTFADDEKNSKNIILNETSEFCRNLGAWRSSYSYEAEKEKEPCVLEEFEDSLKTIDTKKHEEKWKDFNHSSDSDMEVDPEESEPISKEAVTILDEEPNLNHGVGSAIKMAMTKGYLESDKAKVQASNLKHLMSKNYFIEDKNRDDDRGSRRSDRGPLVPFSEKKDYVPSVQLDYIDDSGRKLTSKEAFRYLSHKFHGKGSGKLKTEKRMKKVQEEFMMKNMLSTDTPLGTVEKMKTKQKASSTPYIVISGKNQHTDLRK